MTLKAEKFEEMLAGELNRTLEPQRGKALASFRTYVAEEAQHPAVAGSIKPGKDISRGETWFWASAPSLVAACLAVVVTLKLLGSGAAVPTSAPGNDTSLANSAPAGVRVVIPPEVQQSEQFTQNNGKLAHVQQFNWDDPGEKSHYKLTSDEQETPVKAPF